MMWVSTEEKAIYSYQWMRMSIGACAHIWNSGHVQGTKLKMIYVLGHGLPFLAILLFNQSLYSL